MNYNKEIPFEYMATNFVYETDEIENPKPNLNLTNISI